MNEKENIDIGKDVLGQDNPNTSPRGRMEQRIEDIWGNFPLVTAAPTWTPRTFSQAFAIYSTGGVYRFYIYDFTSLSWRYTALT